MKKMEKIDFKGSGSGDGYDCGAVYGDGSGDGAGFGSGYGDSSGDGYGFGYNYGDGSGYDKLEDKDK